LNSFDWGSSVTGQVSKIPADALRSARAVLSAFPICKVRDAALEIQRRAPRAAFVIAAFGLVISFALATRLLGFNTNPLWLDEAWRANLVLDPNWPATLLSRTSMSTITSPIYALFNHLIGSIHASSGALRLTSFVPGVAAVALMIPVVARLTGSILLGVAAALGLALNPTLIQYSNEFKPYALELFMHLGLVYLALRASQTICAGISLNPILFWMVLCVAPLATLVATNSVFILPGYYALLGVSVLKTERRLPWGFMASAAVAILLLAVQYVLLWSGDGRASLMSYWQPNFYDGVGNHFGWIGARLQEMLDAGVQTHPSKASAGFRYLARPFAPDGVRSFFAPGVTLLAISGLAACADWRKPERFLLVALPIVGVAAANFISIWPLGAVRPNVFSYGYFVLLVVLGIVFATQAEKALRVGVAAALISGLLILSFPDDTAFFRDDTKPPTQEIPMVLGVLSTKLPRDCAAKTSVYVTPLASHAVTYYTMFDQPARASKAGRVLKKCAVFSALPADAYSNPGRFAEGVGEVLATAPSIWLVWSHLSDAEVAKMAEAIVPIASFEHDADFAGAGLVRITKRPSKQLKKP
jgi:hypothetical protein